MLSSGIQVHPRRQRLTFSCLECRRRKVKCDRRKPCSRCKASKVTCDFDGRGTPATSASTKSPYSTTNATLYPTPLSSTSGRGSLTPCDTTVNNLVRVGNRHAFPPESFWRRFVDSTDEALDPCVQKLEDIFDAEIKTYDIGTHEFDQVRLDSLSADLTREADRAIVNKTRVFGQGHWTTTANEFQILTQTFINSTNLRCDGDFNQICADVRVLLHKCKALAREVKKQRPSRSLTLKDGHTVQGLPSHLTDECINLYIGCFESVYRIVHIPELRREYEKFCTMPDSLSEAEIMKIQLTIAIGSCFCAAPDHDTELITRARATVHVAQGWLAAPFEKDRLSINGLQVQCLLLLARQTLSVGGDLIWVSLGTLIHCAMQMGLNRDPIHFPKMSMGQGEIRRRLWATILEMSLQAALDAGTAPTMSMDDFDTTAPANINDSELSECKDSIGQVSDTASTDTSLQRFLLMSWPMRFELLRHMNGVNANASYEDMLRTSTKLKNICNAIKDILQPQDHFKDFKLNLAEYCLRRFLLSLHRPYAIRARKDIQYYYSRRASTDAAMAMLSPAEDVHFTRLVTVAGGMFKIRLRHLGLALSSELMNDINENGPPATPYRKMLVQAIRDACLEAHRRIESGDWNVRLFMLLNMMLSQAEHVGKVEVNLKMARAAKVALEGAYNTILANLEQAGTPPAARFMSDTFQEFFDVPSFSDIDFTDFLQASSWESPFGMDGWSTLV